MRIIISGLIGQYPLGGVAWDYLQYVVGCARLGHDVYYLEDTGMLPFSPVEGGTSTDPSYTISYLKGILSASVSRIGGVIDSRGGMSGSACQM